MENNENVNEFDTLITLTDEDGNDVICRVLDFIEYDGKEYAIFFPVEDEDGDVIILMVEPGENEDEETLVSVEDDKTIEAVFNIFKEKRKDDFNFAD